MCTHLRNCICMFIFHCVSVCTRNYILCLYLMVLVCLLENVFVCVHLTVLMFVLKTVYMSVFHCVT